MRFHIVGPVELAGFGVDAFLWVKPTLAAGAARMAALGAAILLSVGWITPLGKSFLGGGADARTVWLSITELAPSAWIRLVAFDTAFGAGAGLIAYGLVHGVAAAAAHRRRGNGKVLAPAGSPS